MINQVRPHFVAPAVVDFDQLDADRLDGGGVLAWLSPGDVTGVKFVAPAVVDLGPDVAEVVASELDALANLAAGGLTFDVLAFPFAAPAVVEETGPPADSIDAAESRQVTGVVDAGKNELHRTPLPEGVVCVRSAGPLTESDRQAVAEYAERVAKQPAATACVAYDRISRRPCVVEGHHATHDDGQGGRWPVQPDERVCAHGLAAPTGQQGQCGPNCPPTVPPVEEPTRTVHPGPADIAKAAEFDAARFAAPAHPKGYGPLAARLHTDLTAAVRAFCAADPRTLQVDIGPSEIGGECDSQIIRKALGFPAVNQPDPWASFVGTAVHDRLAQVFDAYNRALGREEWLIERKVYVTGGIYGSCDLFRDGVVIDHKIVGTDSMRLMKKGWEAVPKYRKQVHQYGLGWVRAGYEVTDVVLAAWPRSGFLDGLHLLVEAYDPAIAEEALQRLANLTAYAAQHNLDEDDSAWRDVPAAPGKACGFCVFYDPIMSDSPAVAAGLPPVPTRKACPLGRLHQSDKRNGKGRQAP